MKSIIGYNLSSDKSSLKITVDLAGRLRRRGTAGNCPCAGFIRAGGEEGDVVEELVTRIDHALKSALLHADIFEECKCLVGLELSEILFKLRTDGNNFHAVLRGVGNQLLGNIVFPEVAERIFIGVRTDKCGCEGQKLHGFCNAVFHGTGGVEVFELGNDLSVELFIFFEISEFEKRSTADEISDRIFDIHIGTLMAIAVNVVHLPRHKNRDRVFFVQTKDLAPDRLSRIPSAALFRLNYLYNDGAKISLVSEHAPAFFILQMSEARLTVPMIVMDGAAIYDAGSNEFLYSETITPEDSERIRTRLNALGFSYFIYTIHHDKTCIFHQGKVTEQEKVIYDKMKSSPYRSYLEGEIYEPEEVVYYKIIATDGMITGMMVAIRGLLADGTLRAVIRPQAGAPGISCTRNPPAALMLPSVSTRTPSAQADGT